MALLRRAASAGSSASRLTDSGYVLRYQHVLMVQHLTCVRGQMTESSSRKLASSWQRLGAREREIMESLFRRGEASVADVLADLTEPPSYSAVRAMLGYLEQKGHVRHRRDGLRYLYSATVKTERAGGKALRRLIDTFFAGSPERAVAALLDLPDDATGAMSVDEIRQAILRAQRQGR